MFVFKTILSSIKFLGIFRISVHNNAKKKITLFANLVIRLPIILDMQKQKMLKNIDKLENYEWKCILYNLCISK